MNHSTDTSIASFIRIPRPGKRCPVTQLSRSTIYELITPRAANNYKPPVVSHLMKTSRYSKRGARLIDRESLLSYIKDGDGSSGSKATRNLVETA